MNTDQAHAEAKDEITLVTEVLVCALNAYPAHPAVKVAALLNTFIFASEQLGLVTLADALLAEEMTRRPSHPSVH